MSDQQWISSLRGNGTVTTPYATHYSFQETQTAFVQGDIVVPEGQRHLKPAENITRQEVLKMHATCFKCRKVIESGKIYSSQCCDQHYRLCWSCGMTVSFIYPVVICDNCSKNLYREHFKQMETTCRLRPRCDKCDQEKQLDYVLQCQCKICSECFDKDMFFVYVNNGETKRKTFISCTKHGVDKELQSVERVHTAEKGQGINKMPGKTKNETMSGTPVEEQTWNNKSRKTPESFEMQNMTAKTVPHSQYKSDTSSEPRTTEVAMDSDELQKKSEQDSTTFPTGKLPSFRDQREILGIPNIGLTCYASCILQILGQTPDFKENLRKNCQENGRNYIDTLLKDLLENLNVGADGHFIINWLLMERLMDKIFRIDSSFRRYEENDCHSFIMTLLNALKKERSQQETGTDEDLETISSDGKHKDGYLHRPNTAMCRKYTTTVEQDQSPAALFESRLVSKFTYKPCGHEEEIDDQLFRSILVPVQNDWVQLKIGVNMFFKGEEFLHNMLPCRSCNVSNENTVTTRVIRIAKAPKVLMLQLSRFEEVQNAGAYKELKKTGHQVMFEKNLTLDQSEDGKELEYELYGVVIHSGSMHGGHYSSFVRKQHTSRWFYCSDSRVCEVKEGRIFEAWVLQDAYVLFYSRKM